MPTRPPKPPKRTKSERKPRRMNGFLRFLDGSLSFIFLSFLLVAAVAIWLRQSFDAPGPLADTAAVVIPKGVGAIEIAERLEKSNVIADRRVFMLQYYIARVYGGTGTSGPASERASLKAGEYEFPKEASVRQVLDTLISGRGILQKITIPEGLTSQQIVERLRAEQGLSGEITNVPPEGLLLPDTYKISRGSDRQEILDRMRSEQGKALMAMWEARDRTLPLNSPEEAITLASIVEKETGRADERPRVAAVFINRLRKGMRLQSDPTIVYGIAGGQGPLGRPLTRSDIDGKTPYNTYQVDGLPPGPICNPGRAALAATLNPPATQDLYFVADGTGGHVFTSTLKDHNAAVQNWRKVEKSRQVASEPAEQGPEEATPAKNARVPALLNSAKRNNGNGTVPVPRKKPKDSR
ncbi:MAG: endolytic transglycosylase MltG [Hyphomicrobiaceae bacterium]